MKIIIISNRLPVVLKREGEQWRVHSGSGGLVTAFSSILCARGGVWIGWPGIAADEAHGVAEPLQAFGEEAGYGLVPLEMSADEVHGFYHGFCNEIVWPLFHDLQSRCNFVPEYWETYRRVTRRFAEVIHEQAGPDDFLWVQDYQLMGLGQRLREHRASQAIGFFLHIPFPPPDIFAKLPWRAEVLDSLLWYTTLGFQTPRDRNNFLDCVRKLLRGAHVRRRGRFHDVEYRGRTCTVGTFPIGIDYDEFVEQAARPATTERVRAIRSELTDRQIILGVDRLDYTKGLTYRLKAFQQALQRFPELHRKVTLMQVVVPSREAVPEYQDLKAEIERLVTQINGIFTQPGWVPIHYVFRDLDREELVAFYRAADVGFVTPLKDGMNLVAKEYCACQVEENGVLILSEFAGAAAQLSRAILVNPYDLEHVAEALRRAVTMPLRERRPLMRRLRALVRAGNVHWWAEEFLKACGVAQPRQSTEDEYTCAN